MKLNWYYFLFDTVTLRYFGFSVTAIEFTYYKTKVRYFVSPDKAGGIFDIPVCVEIPVSRINGVFTVISENLVITENSVLW